MKPPFTFVPQILSSMRGEKVYNEMIKGRGLKGTERKGRNNTLVNKRNDCLVSRYFYYASRKNKCYEEILRLLMSEFFIAQLTIAYIVRTHTDELQSLKEKDPALFFFQNRWPHLKW